MTGGRQLTRRIVLIALVPVVWLPIHAGLARSVSARAASASLQPLVREPYLQKVSAAEATVVWASVEPGPGEVRYRVDGATDFDIAPAVTTLFPASLTGMSTDYYQHEATLAGLSPATTYSYDVFVGGVDATAATDQLTTAPANGVGTVRFIVFGDSGSGTESQQRLADLMAADSRSDRWDFALHVGDVAYPKSSYEFLHERFFAFYQDWLRRRPIFPAIGNHEDYAADGKPYLDLFVLPENGANPRFPDHRERYYSFDYGPVHFVALDTQLAMSGTRRQEQLNWLASDLEATTQPWRIVFFHIPAYGSSDFASDLSMRQAFEPVFERYGVQLVLAGHEHDYARGAPWVEGAMNSPVMHVVSGGGGASLNQPTPGPWLARWARAYHYLIVSVSDCTVDGSCELTLQAIDDHGAQFDSFTLPRRAQERDAAGPDVDWVAPPDGAILSNTVTVAATATDDEQIAKVDFWVDGELRVVDPEAPYEWSWDTRRELNGDRVVELRALDIAGHQTVSASRVVRVNNAAPTVRLLSPVATERVFAGLPYTIRWIADAGSAPLTRIRIYLAADGVTFQPIPECADLPVTARECVWSAPGPLTRKAVVRIVVGDAAGNEVSDVSGRFEVRSGIPVLALRFPDKAADLGVGSTHSVYWASPLGLGATYQIELSRDGGASWSVLAPTLLGLTNAFRWTVTAPATTQGLVRVRTVSAPLEDVSSVPFNITEPSLRVAAPSVSTTWTAGTQAKVTWKSNLGAYDRLNVRLSTDGGFSFPFLLAASVPGTGRVAAVTVPPVATATARIRIESLDHAEWQAISQTFTITP